MCKEVRLYWLDASAEPLQRSMLKFGSRRSPGYCSAARSGLHDDITGYHRVMTSPLSSRSFVCVEFSSLCCVTQRRSSVFLPHDSRPQRVGSEEPCFCGNRAHSAGGPELLEASRRLMRPSQSKPLTTHTHTLTHRFVLTSL